VFSYLLQVLFVSFVVVVVVVVVCCLLFVDLKKVKHLNNLYIFLLVVSCFIVFDLFRLFDFI